VLRQELRGFGIRVALALMFFTPLYLVLTVHFEHENLFALVLLLFAGCLAASGASTSSAACADRSSLWSGLPLR